MKKWIWLPALALVGCGPYGYWEAGIIADDHHHVEVEYVDWTWEYLPPYPEVQLDINLTWDGDDDPSNLDLILKTPEGVRISDANAHYVDCDHFGDDPGYAYGGIEQISCLDPWDGTYEVQVENNSFGDATAHVSVRFIEIGGYSDTVREFQSDTLLFAGESVRIPVTVR